MVFYKVDQPCHFTPFCQKSGAAFGILIYFFHCDASPLLPMFIKCGLQTQIDLKQTGSQITNCRQMVYGARLGLFQ